MERSRGWVFTLNNYAIEDIVVLDQLDVKYMLYGKEIGESGTPHLQGMVYLHLQKTLKATKAFIGINEIHLEVMRHIEKSIVYCKKDGQFTERGTAPKGQKEKGEAGANASKARWDEALLNAKRGRFHLIDSQLQISQCRNLEYIFNRALNARTLPDTTCRMLWLWGPTGTGKSRAARFVFPGAYDKMCNKWWDGYIDQRVALIEDIDPSHAKLCHHMKIWMDRYPFTAEVKGLVRSLRPEVIVVTSNYHPMSIWPDASDHEPILRRAVCLNFTAEETPLLEGYRLPDITHEDIPGSVLHWCGPGCEHEDISPGPSLASGDESDILS